MDAHMTKKSADLPKTTTTDKTLKKEFEVKELDIAVRKKVRNRIY